MTAEQVDHAAEARRLLDSRPVGHAADGAWATAIGTEALVHATLAVAEQQRIANLVALNSMANDLARATGGEIGAEVAGLLADESTRKTLGL